MPAPIDQPPLQARTTRRRSAAGASGTARLIHGVREVLVVGLPSATALLPARALLGGDVSSREVVLGALSALACVGLLLLRRRAPLVVVSGMGVLVCIDSDVLLAVLTALVSLAVRSSWRRTAVGGGILLLGFAVRAAVFAPVPQPVWREPGSLLLAVVTLVATAGTGLYLGARRQLLVATRERAERAEAEQHLLAERARDRERARIAREMHDVLAHRLSMLSLHAGALEYRADLAGGEVARAAGVVRENAHAALQDLRDVLGVLRADSGPRPLRQRSAGPSGPAGDVARPDGRPAGLSPTAAGATAASVDDPDDLGLRPQPSLAQVPELVAEATAGGATVASTSQGHLGDVSPALGLAGYRVVQEGLTNARKHAPGAEVQVHVLVEDAALTVQVVNTRPPTARPLAASDALAEPGVGLIGVVERAELFAGRVDHGPTTDGGYRLRVVLPRGRTPELGTDPGSPSGFES